MPAGQSDARRFAGKLTRALKLLEEDAYQQMRGNRQSSSLPWFGAIVRQWRDWKNGIPPSREWSGRAAQNPYLLLAFDALDRAEGRANETRREEIERQRRTAQRR